MSLKTLIADDEVLARRRLRQLLAAEEDIDIVEECRNGREVVDALRVKTVDLVFLDIQMPGNTGFDVIETVGPLHMPLTVFVTAHNVYAVQAFDVHALDYLIKPIDPERLQTALSRVRQRLAADSALSMRAQLSSFLDQVHSSNRKDQRSYPQRLLIPGGAEDAFVSVDDIEWIEAADDYANIHVGTKSYLLRETIKQLALSLDPDRFVRIHRSAIVNIRFISKILREGRTDGWLVLTNGQRLRMSKAGWQGLLVVTDL